MKIRIRSLTVEEAVEILRALNCVDDPIIFRGRDTTPGQIIYSSEVVKECAICNAYSIRASDVHIKFWGYLNNHFVERSGSLYTMVLDRLQND